MATLGKTIRMRVAATLLLTGVTVGAQGGVTEGGFSFGRISLAASAVSYDLTQTKTRSHPLLSSGRSVTCT